MANEAAGIYRATYTLACAILAALLLEHEPNCQLGWHSQCQKCDGIHAIACLLRAGQSMHGWNTIKLNS